MYLRIERGTAKKIVVDQDTASVAGASALVWLLKAGQQKTLYASLTAGQELDLGPFHNIVEFEIIKTNGVTVSNIADDFSDPKKIVDLTYIDSYGAGTGYSLTNTSAAVTLGTTSPSVTLPAPGKYLVHVDATLANVGATFAADRTVTLKVRRTNNTATDAPNSTRVSSTGIITTITNKLPPAAWSFIYDCQAAGDILSLFADVSTVPTAGSLQITNANIVAVNLNK